MHATATSSEFVNLKARLKKTWMAGDYDRFSRYMENGARDFYERLDTAPGAHFLDVACGSGQLALIAAREGLEVTGVDIAGNLVERARERAQAEGLPARFEEADAEALPFEDASFDIVASLVGAMFAPRPDLVAQELLRVCSPGGTLAMVNWTPQGFIGQMFSAVSKFIAPSGQIAEFDEYTVVLRGTLRVETRAGTIDVKAGQAILARRGEWVRYSTLEPNGAQLCGGVYAGLFSGTSTS